MPSQGLLTTNHELIGPLLLSKLSKLSYHTLHLPSPIHVMISITSNGEVKEHILHWMLWPEDSDIIHWNRHFLTEAWCTCPQLPGQVTGKYSTTLYTAETTGTLRKRAGSSKVKPSSSSIITCMHMAWIMVTSIVFCIILLFTLHSSTPNSTVGQRKYFGLHNWQFLRPLMSRVLPRTATPILL